MNSQSDSLLPQQAPRFNQEQRGRMLDLARGSIASYLGGLETSIPKLDFLKEPSGAFVTLRKDGALRGCIGSIEPACPLGETIANCAVSSAVKDPRFAPLKIEELDFIHVEISVISPMQKTKSVEEIIVGNHGVMIEFQNRYGLLLPQVAVEHGWDRDTLLDHVCVKAGLATDTWKKPEAVLHIFTAEIFGEE